MQALVRATLQPLGPLNRRESGSVGSDGGDDMLPTPVGTEDVLLCKLSASYYQGHFLGPGSRVGCKTSIRSATVRGGSNPEGRVRVIFSLIRGPLHTDPPRFPRDQQRSSAPRTTFVPVYLLRFLRR
jgi:hypothetical protein